MIQQAVAKLVAHKTVIVIAHRLSTITDADNIVVVHDGRIEAQGTHEALLEDCALYHEMWQAHMGARMVTQHDRSIPKDLALCRR